MDANTTERILINIRDRIRKDEVRVTQHAHQEMVEEEITLDEVYEAIAAAKVLEDYPEHRRGACCLLGGFTKNGRPLHVVCTTSRPVLIIITVYVPKPPKWIAPFQRGTK